MSRKLLQVSAPRYTGHQAVGLHGASFMVWWEAALRTQKRDESLRSLMKGHSILRFSKRHLFLQQNNFIAKVPLATGTTDLAGYLIYQGYRSD